jgi:hypothetical protein
VQVCCAVCTQDQLSGGTCDNGFTPVNGQCVFSITYNCDPEMFIYITNNYPCANSFSTTQGQC